jgi:Bacterial transcriptional activator domain
MLALYRAGRQAEALDAYRRARRELAEQLGLEPSEDLRRLEQAILRQDPALAPAREEPRPPSATDAPVPGRSLLIVPRAVDGVDALVRLAELLAGAQPARELVIVAIVENAELASATAALAVRTAAFSSHARGRDVVRLASRENVDLLLVEAPRAGLGGDLRGVLDANSAHASSVESRGRLRRSRSARAMRTPAARRPDAWCSSEAIASRASTRSAASTR